MKNQPKIIKVSDLQPVGGSGPDHFRAPLIQTLRFDNYGTTTKCEEYWTVTDILKSRKSPMKIYALQVISGSYDGRADSSREIMDPDTGEHINVKLQVLTRAACKWDSDGNKLSQIYELKDDNPPQPGDIVAIKLGQIKNSLGHKLNGEEIREREAYGEDIYRWKKYKVDKNGCITVSINDAISLLKKHGKRTGAPTFTYTRDGDRVPAHFFTEVF